MRFTNIQQSFFFGLLALVTIGFIWLINDFLFSVFWAIVLAIIFYPLEQWWLLRTRGRSVLATTLTMLTVIILIFTPLFFVGSLATQETVDYYQKFSGQVSNKDSALFVQLSSATDFLERLGISKTYLEENIAKLAKVVTSWLGTQAVAFGQNIFHFGLLFFVMLYMLFFMLKDGPRLEQRLLDILPLGDTKERRLFKKFASTTRATIKGTFVIAFIQGTIGGVLFLIAGIGAPFLWGTLMAILSVIPALGASIIWLPAGILLLFGGFIWQGLVVLVGGAAIISLIDNLLRPVLVGKDSEMPDMYILLSTLGGLAIFGISGFVIGPIIAAFFLAMWHMFEEEYKVELETRG